MRIRNAFVATSVLLAVCCAVTPSAAQTTKPIRVLVAYFSQTGNTEKLAQAVAAGAKTVQGVEVVLAKMVDVKDDAFASFDGFAIGTPVHWGSLSTESRGFLDRLGAGLGSTKVWGDGRVAGAFCTGGLIASGKEMARLAIIASLMEMRFIIVGGVDGEGFGTLGPQATTGPADPGMSEKELSEGRVFGERLARITKQLRSTTR